MMLSYLFFVSSGPTPSKQYYYYSILLCRCSFAFSFSIFTSQIHIRLKEKTTRKQSNFQSSSSLGRKQSKSKVFKQNSSDFRQYIFNFQVPTHKCAFLWLFIVITRSQWILDTTHDLKYFICNPHGFAIRDYYGFWVHLWCPKSIGNL